MFYIADKADKSCQLSEILREINEICFKSALYEWEAETKKQALVDLLKNKNIRLKIPCLLAYTRDIYSDEKELNLKIKNCVHEIVQAFDQTDFQIIKELEYELMFCVFPLSDIKALREKIVEFKKSGG